MTAAIEENIEWIESGKIGCVFASALVKQRNKIGWKFYLNENVNECYKDVDNNKVFIASIVYPGMSIWEVRQLAIDSGMYIEDIDGMYEGLRLKMPNNNVAWVQYFGPDSHVKTRQSPHPMLSFTAHLPSHVYAKTMVKGIYHLAHASIEYLTSKKANTLWEQSFAKTRKILGHSPSLAEAAKTTFVK